MISPLAHIHPGAKLGENCIVEPFVYIDDNVVIGDNCHIMAHASILSGTRMGNNNKVYHGAVVGGTPQDLKFVGEDTTLEIGDNNMIRENVTLNRGTASKGKTVIGSNNLFMENVHIGHDSVIGNGCILGNSTKIAGEVTISDFAILSACVLVHQFSHIGSYVMIQGGSRINKDVPPYIIVAREPAKYCGLNIVGLRRRGFSNESIKSIHAAYHHIYGSGTIVSTALARIREGGELTPEVEYILHFIEKESERGILG
ncbi:MAG: acyl-ACP--UDP-N-acetylglucosamine O-acyltransferase [Bacteroidaceae bacterium]|nr:acyl-ACP--UDP-N-acetylglucosamine O-acyltransferase [Bacteroidaceae bacterium]